MVRTDCSQLVMFDAANLDESNSVNEICRTNLTGLLSPDLLFVYVSNAHLSVLLLATRIEFVSIN